VTNLAENYLENYVERSLEEINKGNINHVVRTELMIGVTWRLFLMKFFNLLTQKGVLTFEEIEGVASEAFDTLEWSQQKIEERYQIRLTEIEAQVTKLEKRLEEMDKKKPKQN
jgi:hypothetical protein